MQSTAVYASPLSILRSPPASTHLVTTAVLLRLRDEEQELLHGVSGRHEECVVPITSTRANTSCVHLWLVPCGATESYGSF